MQRCDQRLRRGPNREMKAVGGQGTIEIRFYAKLHEVMVGCICVNFDLTNTGNDGAVANFAARHLFVSKHIFYRGAAALA